MPLRQRFCGGQDGISRVFILLSTYNGEPYLPEQLKSLVQQCYGNWQLYWRDDGSSDATVPILSEFTGAVGADRCTRVLEPTGRILPAASFMALLRAVVPILDPADVVAFADQDDIWFPDKLARGIEALATIDMTVPTLYCAQLRVVNADLSHIRETRLRPERCCFPASLTQNVATGCTVMMNYSAASLVAESAPTCTPFHDWWSYLVVTAAGGRVLMDDRAVALYRQHPGNFIGIRASLAGRAIAALRRGPMAYMNILRGHVADLLARPMLVGQRNYPVLLEIQEALEGNVLQRVRVLCHADLRRQGWLETLLFRIWFLIG
jgi:Glycosyl transferase family 2